MRRTTGAGTSTGSVPATVEAEVPAPAVFSPPSPKPMKLKSYEVIEGGWFRDHRFKMVRVRPGQVLCWATYHPNAKNLQKAGITVREV